MSREGISVNGGSQTATPTDAQHGDADQTGTMPFKRWRRLALDQIMARKHLPAIARVTAYALASMTNKTSRGTCAAPDTIARRVGETHREMARGIKMLVESGQLKIARRDNGIIDKFLILRPDIPIPDTSIIHAGKEWYKTGEARESR
jgi:hypothetical protein